MKNVLLFLAFAGTALAQYQTVPSTNYPALEAVLNAKPAVTLFSGVPSGGCTQGKDLALNTATSPASWYGCSSPNVWTPLSAASGGTVTSVGIAGTANQINVTGTCTITTTGTCTISLPNNVVLPGTIDGLTITTTTGTITLANAKTFTINNSLTLVGTDGVTITMPSTNATMARTDAAQTFAGIQTFSSPPVMSGASMTAGTMPPNVLATVQGNGAKAQLSTGATTTNDCVKFDANGNTVDAGSACGGGSGGVDPTNMTTPVGSWFVTDTGPLSPSPYAYSPSCTNAGGVGVAGVDAISVVPWYYWKTTGNGTICGESAPGGSGFYGVLQSPDFFSGSTPITHVLKARFATVDRNADLFVGLIGSAMLPLTTFVGCEALTTDTDWFAVIRNATVATRVDTGIPVVLKSNDVTGGTQLTVSNGAGVANSITCSVSVQGAAAGTATVSGGTTIQTGLFWRRFVGTLQVGATANNWALSWIGYKWSGVGTIQ